MMKLNPLMKLRVDIKPQINIGDVPYGTRQVFDVSGGAFEGERLRGFVHPSGADWLLIDGEGVGHIDVRVILETYDGARIYAQYFGVLVLGEQMRAIMARDGMTAYGDTYFMTQPRFETGDARFKWLNRVVAVAEGRVLTNAVEYQVFELVH